ncbi:MAG TPA: hypothetical protein VF668_17405 [Pyrinomonadaceae bacterium]|jgi:hypothetical protein
MIHDQTAQSGCIPVDIHVSTCRLSESGLTGEFDLHPESDVGLHPPAAQQTVISFTTRTRPRLRARNAAAGHGLIEQTIPTEENTKIALGAVSILAFFLLAHATAPAQDKTLEKKVVESFRVSGPTWLVLNADHIPYQERRGPPNMRVPPLTQEAEISLF